MSDQPQNQEPLPPSQSDINKPEEEMASPPDSAPSQPTSTSPMSLAQRSAVLQGAIRDHVSRGFQVVSQSETTAQLLKPKKFSCLIATVTFLFFAVPFFIYLFWYMASSDQQIYLEVDDLGRLHVLRPGQKTRSVAQVTPGQGTGANVPGQSLANIWNSGPGGKVALLGGVALCCLFSVVGTVLSPPSERAPTPTREMATVPLLLSPSTQTSTNAPPSNPTKVAPTPTGGPSVTQTISTTLPTETIDSDDLSYRILALLALTDLTSGMEGLAPLLTQAGEDPTVILDATWRSQVALRAEQIRQADEDMHELTPPPYLADAHAVLLSGTSDCSAAMDSLETGIELVDASYVETAGELMSSCTDKINDAADMIEAASPTGTALP